MNEAGAGPPPAAASLPAAVRQRVVALAAEVLGSMPTDEVPAPLRAVARFAPARRARAGATALAATLESDPLFRQRVAAGVRAAQPELAAAVEAGTPPPAAPPGEVAAVAYLTRPEGWAAMVDVAAGQLAEVEAAGRQAEQQQRATVDRERLEAAVEQARAEARRARDEVEVARGQAADSRRRLREVEADLGRARAAEAAARLAETTVRDELAAAAATAAGEMRRLRTRVDEVEAALEAARRSAREGRGQADIRLRLLLETVVEAAHGLRQELALPPTTGRPADAVAADVEAARRTGEGPGVTTVPARGLADDDPAVLDQLLQLPRVHLVVDGYNVTKTGYGDLPLAVQRERLLSGLAALAARTRAEVTCVFDGTTLDGPVPSSAARGVRVLFSPRGQSADELIRRLVRAEPPGRAVVVVSTDREVAEGVARAGARPVASAALLRRLDRG